jgi:hypothetical protein
MPNGISVQNVALGGRRLTLTVRRLSRPEHFVILTS